MKLQELINKHYY